MFIFCSNHLHMMKTDSLAILGVISSPEDSHTYPLFMEPVRAGFPSPAEGYRSPDLDLHTHLVKHPAATFFLRVEGDSMQGYGIFEGDLLVVDRAIEPRGKEIVVVALDGELTCKKLSYQKGRPVLLAGNVNYPPLFLDEAEVQIWGVVLWAIHSTYPAIRVDEAYFKHTP